MLILCCCRPNIRTVASLDGAFSTEQIESLDAAFAAWREGAPACADRLQGLRFRRAYSWREIPGGRWNPFDDSRTIGMWVIQDKEIWLDFDYTKPDEWEALAVHEMGHAIGLVHEANGIMAPAADLHGMTPDGRIPQDLLDRAQAYCLER